jgi:hypothetical protein
MSDKDLVHILGLKAESFRDSLGDLLQQTLWTVSDAYALVGEADLLVDPASDELWRAKALRALGDVEYASTVLNALREHLSREDTDVEQILAERRAVQS